MRTIEELNWVMIQVVVMIQMMMQVVIIGSRAARCQRRR
jgi:hypothetical protein